MIFLTRFHVSHVRHYRLVHLIYLIFVLLIIPLNSAAQPTITLNSAADAPLTTDGRDGFLDQVARNIFNKIGYKLTIEKLPAERALRSANSGLIDGEIIRVGGMEKHYPNLIRVPEKIMSLGFFVFSKKQIDLRNGWSALAEKNVAFINGWKIAEKNTPNTAAVTRVKDSQQLFSLLEKDRADFVIYEHWGGNYIINQSQLTNVSMVQPALATNDMYIYLHKRHKAIVPKLSQALTDMKKDGSYEKLAEKHLLPIRRTE